MKIISALFFIFPAMTFACPVFTGKYNCASADQTWRIDSMTFSKTNKGFDVLFQRYGWHIEGGDDQPFSGKPVTGPYQEKLNYDTAQQTIPDGSGGTYVTNVSCDAKTIYRTEAYSNPDEGAALQLTWNSTITADGNDHFIYHETVTRGTDETDDGGTFVCKKAN